MASAMNYKLNYKALIQGYNTTSGPLKDSTRTQYDNTGRDFRNPLEVMTTKDPNGGPPRHITDPLDGHGLEKSEGRGHLP